MSSVSHYDPGDLALFAMQLLPRNEHAAMSAHISDCSYCRQELANLQGDLAAYAHGVEMHSPPALAREHFLNQIAREKRFAPGTSPIEHEPAFEPSRLPDRPGFQRPERTPPPRSERFERLEAAAAGLPMGYANRSQAYPTGLGSGRYLDEDDNEQNRASLPARLFTNVFPWIGWAAAATLAIFAGNLYHERNAQRVRLTAQAGQIDRLSSNAAAAQQLLETLTDSSARQVTLTQANTTPEPPRPQGRVTYVASRGALIFLATNLEPVDTYKTYELWLIPSDGRDPIPAGTFRPDNRGNASVVLPPLPKGIEAKAFGVTLEDDGGAQTPTMPILLAGN
ncbi:anti-sigma factor [Edaphobacter flagellatus]|uniref:anti-sigma factor n=1 Tax=Edaphobacter flagellatus TaxID=1933044 RepID=UPI0021B32FB6|nr:anti-sigma factor [Edaphobacter flagellatus]